MQVKIYYDPESRGFYRNDIHSNIPVSCKEVSEDLYVSLMEKQSEGYTIQPDKEGLPFAAIEETELTKEEVKYLRKIAYIKESDFLKIEAEFDAIKLKKKPDYSKWVAKVEEIKLRYPFNLSSKE